MSADAIDRDHHELAQMIEAIGRICDKPERPHGDCVQCPQGVNEACQNAVIDLSSRMMSLLLTHFERENALMDELQPLAAVKNHCDRHRREHVDFSTRFNRMLSALHASSSACAIRTLDDFVLDWTRRHALEFDKELVGLLAAYHRPESAAVQTS